MADRKVFPHPIPITSELVKTIVDTLETAASKHLRRSLSPKTWVSKDVIRHSDLVEKAKRYFGSNSISLSETAHSGERVTCKIVCNLYDESVHADNVSTFWGNAREVEQERKLRPQDAEDPTAPSSPDQSSSSGRNDGTHDPEVPPPPTPQPPEEPPTPHQTYKAPPPTAPDITAEAQHLFDTVNKSIGSKLAEVRHKMHDEIAKSFADVHASIKSLADKLQDPPKPTAKPSDKSADLIRQFIAALLA